MRIIVYGCPAPQGELDRLPRHIREGVQIDPQGCWLWQKSRNLDGYGWTSLRDVTHEAHRLTFILLRGTPPKGTVIDHLCRVRHCVNPWHMEPVTNAENLRRGDTPAGWERCQNCGGEFSILRKQRRCLPCRDAYEESRKESKRIYMRARYYARKQAGV